MSPDISLHSRKPHCAWKSTLLETLLAHLLTHPLPGPTLFPAPPLPAPPSSLPHPLPDPTLFPAPPSAPPPGATNRTEGGLPYPVWQYLLFVGTDVGWVCGTAGLTGVLLMAVLLVIVLCSLPCIRRRGLFEVHTTPDCCLTLHSPL